MNSLTTFDFNSNSIRVIDRDGNPWFVGADVLTILYGQTGGMANVYRPLDSSELTKVKRVHLGMKPGRDAVIISESGLYKLVLRSDKPQAKPFQDWVTKVVLPAIRKDGAYVAGEEKLATGELSEEEFILRAMAMMQRRLTPYLVGGLANTTP